MAKKSLVERLEALRTPIERASEQAGRIADAALHAGESATKRERRRVATEKTVLLKEIDRLKNLVNSL